MEYERKFLYGMEYGMEDFWYGMEMEWKKIANMEYGKIVFHSIPCPAFRGQTDPLEAKDRNGLGQGPRTSFF